MTDSALNEAVERVTRYLDRLCKSRQYDHESIHAFDLGEPSEAVLGVADLRAILAALPSQSSTLAAMASVLEALLDHDEWDDGCMPTDAHLDAQNEARATLTQYRQGAL